MKNEKIINFEEQYHKLKNEVRQLNREISQKNRIITAMENNFQIKMNMFRALAKENEKYRRYLTHMMKSSADFIILLDKELNIAYCSELFIKKIGVKYFIDIEGKDIFEVYAKLNNKELFKTLKENLFLVLTNNKTCRHDIIYDIENNGELRTFRITNTPMIDESTGETNGILIMWSDTADIIPTKESRGIKDDDYIQTLPVFHPVKKEESKKDAPLDIPGVDVQHGIKMTGGTIEGYREVLKVFCHDFKLKQKKIKTIPSVEKLSSYIIDLHAIAGSSASIGARGISEKAYNLKSAAERGNMPFLQEKIPGFAEQLNELIEQIQKKL